MSFVLLDIQLAVNFPFIIKHNQLLVLDKVKAIT